MESKLNADKYRFLDIMKFVMAIVVVAIHTRPEISFNSAFIRQNFEVIYSLAVPFFFIASGFLLFRKVEFPLNADGSKRILGYLSRICRLYLLWTLIYLPLAIYGFWMEGIPPLKAAAVFLRNILLVGENYMSWPLWYLLAVIVAVGIIYSLLKLKVSKNGVLIIGVLMALVGVGLDYCHEHSLMSPMTDIYFSLFLNTRNGIFVGFLYVALGMFCSTLQRVPTKVVVLFFLIGCVAEFMALPLANAFIVLAMFVATISLQIRTSTDTNKLRLMSSVIYFCHMIYVAFFVLLCDIASGCLLFTIVVFASILTGLLFTSITESRFVKQFFA